MGQQEVYDFLTKHPDSWFTSKQISEELAVSIGSVTMSLKKLRKTNIIKYRNTGKRNTFQYMVQSEPTKLEHKTPMMEETHEPLRMRVKIKPKIVHQHTYLGGQTFYGVIRPKEEVEAIERQREEIVRVARVRRKPAVKRVTKKPVTKAKTKRKPTTAKRIVKRMRQGRQAKKR